MTIAIKGEPGKNSVCLVGGGEHLFIFMSEAPPLNDSCFSPLFIAFFFHLLLSPGR